MYVVFLSFDDDENMSMPTICLVQACLTLWRKHSGPILRRSLAGKSLPLTALLDGDRKVDLFHLNMVYILGIYIYTWYISCIYGMYVWYTVYIFDIYGIDMHGVYIHIQYTSNYRPTPCIIYVCFYIDNIALIIYPCHIWFYPLSRLPQVRRTILYDSIWFKIIWYDVVRHDMTWYPMIWHVTWMIYHDLISYDMMCHEMLNAILYTQNQYTHMHT